MVACWLIRVNLFCLQLISGEPGTAWLLGSSPENYSKSKDYRASWAGQSHIRMICAGEQHEGKLLLSVFLHLSTLNSHFPGLCLLCRFKWQSQKVTFFHWYLISPRGRTADCARLRAQGSKKLRLNTELQLLLLSSMITEKLLSLCVDFFTS